MTEHDKYIILLDYVRCQAELLHDNLAQQILAEIGELE